MGSDKTESETQGKHGVIRSGGEPLERLRLEDQQKSQDGGCSTP